MPATMGLNKQLSWNMIINSREGTAPVHISRLAALTDTRNKQIRGKNKSQK